MPSASGSNALSAELFKEASSHLSVIQRNGKLYKEVKQSFDAFNSIQNWWWNRGLRRCVQIFNRN